MTALAIEGATNEEIANELFLSVKTVERHLTSAYMKLGIRSRKELQKHLQAPSSAIVDADRYRSARFRDTSTRLTGLPFKS